MPRSRKENTMATVIIATTHHDRGLTEVELVVAGSVRGRPCAAEDWGRGWVVRVRLPSCSRSSSASSSRRERLADCTAILST
jgi:hypothetical protein